LRHT